MESVRESAEKDAKYSYQRYRELGGIIYEKNYQRALDRARHTVTLDNEKLVGQAEFIAGKSGFTLHNSRGALDQRTILYGILRTDANPGVKYHHSQMGDQQLFAEALKMLEDEGSLKKLIEAHPNIFHSTKNE